jgi:hypothetical protein
MLENQMRQDNYWRAYKMWKKIKPVAGFNVANRMTREEAHERRR